MLFGRDSRKDAQRTANLDFDARVPIPFSVFPSSYRSDAVPETTLVTERVEGEVNLDRTSHVEREDTRTSAPLPDPRVFGKEEVDLRFERRSERRGGDEGFTVVADERVQSTRYPEVDLARERYREQQPTSSRYQDYYQERQQTYDKTLETQLDITERDYRRRTDPTYDVAVSYDRRSQAPVESYEGPQKHTAEVSYSRSGAYDTSYERTYQPPTLEVPRGDSYTSRQTTTVVDHPPARKMGYYDDDVRFREGVREDVRIIEPRGGPNTSAETVPIPCHFVRIGDILVLQGRPSQVIRISVSPQTGQHRYLGVDLFTRELHEESSFISNPSPSVVVQTMLGPVYKTYRILDIRDDNRIVAMTESGDVKQGLPVVPQGSLYQRIRDAFREGRGSVRALVINDGGRELVVDFKVIHASRL
ncbi:Putative Function: N. crassa Hex1 is required for the assembly of the Woronin body [Aspergillus calidoustus]|uniref:Putative Function: N. crassa Hex1 is required for the assembly of the Woronin body n=1 Tax=Aspergillus calidoustus TaxID=454130 RepID=A0A0U4Z084_ASPCI|nr:Putative Function: N. crassa Hex1 is required for the assembly of the Woronin body [Aspergillus calidoustus]